MDMFLVSLVAATLRVATPLIYGTMGETFSERAGILNLGIEGIMFFGSFIGFAVASLTGSLWQGLLAAIISGLLAGLLMGLLSVTLGVSQHVAGLGITILMTSLALFGFRLFFGGGTVVPRIDPFPQLKPFGDMPIIGPIFQQYALTYIAILLVVPLAWWILYRSSFGLQIRAVGENPEAADTAGVNVFRVRYAALSIGGALMAVGGAFLSIAQLGSFTPEIIAGRGWVSIALVIFGNWNPIKALLGTLLFGGVFALQLRLQSIIALPTWFPHQAFLVLPFLATIIALIIAGRNASVPAALLKPYKRE